MKVVKFFVVFNLILSISLINSVAAISVSDGSAFVTKAEFAADLNNLSNRMSTLENSLDAKIDSLVSSYLSRNGIWNGEKQEIKKDFVNESLDTKKIVWIKNYNNKNKNTYLVFRSHQDTLISTVEIISQITKSGLCMLDFISYPIVISATTGIFNQNDKDGYGSNISYDYAASYGWNGNVTYGIYMGKNTDTAELINPDYKSCNSHFIQNCYFSQSYVRGATVNQDLYLIAQKLQQTNYFFVEKDTKMFLCTYLYGGGGRFSRDAWVSFLWVTDSPVSGAGQSPAFNVNKAIIY